MPVSRLCADLKVGATSRVMAAPAMPEHGRDARVTFLCRPQGRRNKSRYKSQYHHWFLRRRFTVKAAVMHEVGKPLRIEDVPIPEIGPEEVLVETRSCGICGTDLHILKGFGYVPKLPHILGHEPAGVVAKVGSKVTHLTARRPRCASPLLHLRRLLLLPRRPRPAVPESSGPAGRVVSGSLCGVFQDARRQPIPASRKSALRRGRTGGRCGGYRRSCGGAGRLRPQETAVVLGAGGIGQVLIQLLRSQNIRVVAVSRSDCQAGAGEGMRSPSGG